MTRLARILWVSVLVAACGTAGPTPINYSAFPYTMPPITPGPTERATAAPTPTLPTYTLWAVHMVTALDELVLFDYDVDLVLEWVKDESDWLKTDVNTAPTGPFEEYFTGIIALLQTIVDGDDVAPAVRTLLELRPTLAVIAGGLVPADPPATAAPDPTPAFAEIELTGKGSRVVKFTIPSDSIAIVKISAKGTSNFVVESLDSSGDTNDLLVNEIGNYTGTVLLDGDLGEHSVAFKIDSNGTWTLTIKPLRSARVWDPSGPLTGKGDDVVLVFPEPDAFTIVELKHGGDSNFAIWTYSSDDRDLLVNEIGRYTGETIVGSDLLLLEITADGSWSITPQ